MDFQQALSAKAHLRLIQSRLNCFKQELEAATFEAKSLEKDKEILVARRLALKEENMTRKKDLEQDYMEQIREYRRQIRVSEEMYTKESEKRRALLGYLQELNISIQMPEMATNFNWASLQEMAIKSEDKGHSLMEQNKKAEQLAQMNERARIRLNDIISFFQSTLDSKERYIKKVRELKEFEQEYEQMLKLQEQKILKLRGDNTRLNLLVKQCVQVNEPMSKHISDTVRAKCQSFLNSKTDEELINGLNKYKLRQERIIKLLRHKEKIVSRDINLLQVATDRTTDQTQYYLDLLKTNDH